MLAVRRGQIRPPERRGHCGVRALRRNRVLGRRRERVHVVLDHRRRSRRNGRHACVLHMRPQLHPERLRRQPHLRVQGWPRLRGQGHRDVQQRRADNGQHRRVHVRRPVPRGLQVVERQPALHGVPRGHLLARRLDVVLVLRLDHGRLDDGGVRRLLHVLGLVHVLRDRCHASVRLPRGHGLRARRARAGAACEVRGVPRWLLEASGQHCLHALWGEVREARRRQRRTMQQQHF